MPNPQPLPRPSCPIPGNPFHGEVRPGGPFKIDEPFSLQKLQSK